jgi:hypothetical protein
VNEVEGAYGLTLTKVSWCKGGWGSSMVLLNENKAWKICRYLGGNEGKQGTVPSNGMMPCDSAEQVGGRVETRLSKLQEL